MKQLTQLTLIALLTTLAACGNNETQTPTPTMDMSMDMVQDIQPDTSEPDMPCVPTKNICEPTDCGMIDNGCGAPLDCGTCACINGEAEAESCGTCNLGKPSCDANAKSKEIASCDYPVEFLSKLDTDLCQTIIYVSTDGQPNATGTTNDPFSTYKEALDSLNDQPGIIIVAKGTYTEPLIIKEGVHVLGGYRFKDELKQLETSIPEFKPPTKQGEPVFGLIAKDIAEPTLVYNVRVIAPDADTEQTSYGAHIVDVQFLTIANSEILAGKGGKGVDGVDGMPGGDGDDHNTKTCFGTVSGETPAASNPSCLAFGGPGGAGGSRINNPSIPKDGRDSMEAKGGDAGSNNSSAAQKSGKDGEDGPKITDPPQNGQEGSPDGIIENDLWMASNYGQDGSDGRNGSGGGGGGGAGGEFRSNPEQFGPAGASGGAGGCGGQAGTGGTNGGSSFGLLLVRSKITINDSLIGASNGGVGGNAGLGGLGGQGGKGGPKDNINCSGQVLIWSAGAGGDGANGQNGGNGGPGAGGSTYGAYCFQSQMSADDKTQLQAGPAADGGTGGARGLVVDQWRCK